MLVFGAGSGSSGIPLSWSATEGRAGVNFLPDYGTRSVYKNRLILCGCGDFINDYEGIGVPVSG